MKIRALKFLFVSFLFIHYSTFSFSQDFVKQHDENTIRFNKAGKFRFTFSGTAILKHEETCELNIKDPANENVDSVSFHIINWGKDNPGFFTDTFSIEGLNNSVGVLFTNPKRASSTKAKLTNFKWIDATKYKARVTWGSPDNQSTVTLDFIEVRQSRFEKTK